MQGQIQLDILLASYLLSLSSVPALWKAKPTNLGIANNVIHIVDHKYKQTRDL